jgi:uncharacterized protein YjbJ (UPF0337 family)
MLSNRDARTSINIFATGICVTVVDVLSIGIRCARGTISVSLDWNRIEGNWKQFGGRVKEKWGKLTDDDLAVINGRRDQLEGKIQERYGLAKDQVRSDIDTWLKSLP